mmetsp:Transcript_12735/g.49642  ORF Transcript_12735/g.49642 Transcript_12735/m.49642 type:complete len:317 (-) Transcript_12735:3037-3987(-)
MSDFVVPQKLVKRPADMRAFEISQAARRLIHFIQSLNLAARCSTLSSETHPRSAVTIERLIAVLCVVECWAVDFPPKKQLSRFGNASFRDWHRRLTISSHDLIRSILPNSHKAAVAELAPYFLQGFGNASRVDYGTGHETMFVCFLLCLEAIGLLNKSDHGVIVTRVFSKYVSIVRMLQTKYWLEPAGSRGAWGLDDYCFLPFYWGSSQLVHHDAITPASIHDDRIVQENANEFLYLDSLLFIKAVKRGSISETSPLLSDISGVMSWEKVNRGLLKMYQVECLGKFPIAQHFLFGTILRMDPASEGEHVSNRAPLA